MELNQEALFPKKEKQALKVAQDKLEKESTVPVGYIPVNLISGEKFNVPVLHFRNYTMEELLQLASSNEDNIMNDLIYKVLNNMCYEKYDCSQLHVNHLIQIMLTIYKNFWGNSLYSQPYYKDLDGDRNSKDNVAYVDIDISKLDPIYLPDNFKQTFTIIDDVTGSKIKFGLSKINHIFFTNKYIKELYKEEEAKFSTLKSKLELIKKLEESNDIVQQEQIAKIPIDEKEREAYDTFLNEKAMMYLRVLQAQLLIAINGKELSTIEDKIAAYKNDVDATAWARYKEIIEVNTFGINPNYTFVVDGKPITRRFSFRYLELIPTVDKKADSRYTVSFDD